MLVSKTKFDECLNVLLYPDYKYIRFVNTINICDKALQRKTVIFYLSEFDRANHRGLKSYINVLKMNDSLCESLVNAYFKQTKTNRMNLTEEMLFNLSPNAFFFSYGVACKECVKTKNLDSLPAVYNSEQKEAIQNAYKGFQATLNSETGELDYRDIDCEDLWDVTVYRAIRPNRRIHQNKKYRTRKKNLNECYRNAIRVMNNYMKLRGRYIDIVFNDGKSELISGFKNKLL